MTPAKLKAWRAALKVGDVVWFTSGDRRLRCGRVDPERPGHDPEWVRLTGSRAYWSIRIENAYPSRLALFADEAKFAYRAFDKAGAKWKRAFERLHAERRRVNAMDARILNRTAAKQREANAARKRGDK